MLVRILRTLDDIEELTLQATCLKEVLSLLPKDTLEELKEGTLHFVLTDSTGELPLVELTPDIADTPFEGYDTLHLARSVEGDGGAIIGAIIAYIGGAGAVAAPGLAGIGWAIGAMAINMAIAMAVSAIIQAIIPTQEFSGDASSSQNSSNLYNGSPLVREQGGSVPLICGDPYCGGVLISSSLSTTESVIDYVNEDKYEKDGLEWFNIPVTFTPVSDLTIMWSSSRRYNGVEASFTYWDGRTETTSSIVDASELGALLPFFHPMLLNKFELKYGYGGWAEGLGSYVTEVPRESSDDGASYFFNVLYKRQPNGN